MKFKSLQNKHDLEVRIMVTSRGQGIWVSRDVGKIGFWKFLYIDLGGNMGAYICKNLLSCILKISVNYALCFTYVICH